MLRKTISFLFVFLFSISGLSAVDKRPYKADLVIYGGTSAAITAAVAAKKLGKSVIVVSPDIHLGGLSSSGLGFTDTGNKEVIGGLSRDFYHRVYLHYQQDTAWKWQKKEEYGNKGQGTPAIDGKDRTMWIFEPHVAEKIMEDYIKENNIEIYRNEWLNRNSGVKMKDGKITAITTLSGKQFSGKMFIDATYEGDLMASAKVSYYVGREANSVYGENWNGVQTEVFQHGHHFKTDIDPYKTPGDKNSGLLAGISGEAPGVKGEGDNKLQAYCFRMCLTNKEENRITFPKPDNYNPANYELLARVFQSGWKELFDKFDDIPNRKTDTNNHGPFSTDYIGMNYDYPEASYQKRKEIIKQHEDYQKGLMYFMITDQRVPAELQKRLQTWGLSKDEFKDNGNWPHQIYVREARRMVSDYVLTENETLGRKEVPKPIGMGSYALDSHNTQRYVNSREFVQNEGDIGVHAPKPYSISYGSIVPENGECSNLLVPVCISSSHIAYGSVRMEPVFMILGESAATAAAIAIDDKVNVQQVSYEKLQTQLLKQKQRLRLNEFSTLKKTTDFNIFAKLKEPFKEESFYGYACAKFTFKGREAQIVKPKIAAKGNPWVWRARFWGHEPQADIALLERGFHIVYCDASELYGNAEAIELWNNYYAYLHGMGLNKKVVLEGMSRGGVYAYNWAAVNPTKVACIYVDNPVLDLKSWPGGKGIGPGSINDWEIFKKDYGYKTEAETMNFKGSPIDKIEQIVKGKYPMLHVCGDADEAVPMSENTIPFAEKIKQAGGNIQLIIKAGAKHHPHSLPDPQPIVDFILKATGQK